jgi:hypothetical protein
MAHPFTTEELAAEEWREIPADPRRLVSSLGRIWNRDTERYRGRIHVGTPRAGGYRGIQIESAQVGVHCLVLDVFVGARPTKEHEGAHWDGVPDNNRLTNLRWATPKENALDKLRHGTWGPSLTPDRVQEIQRRRKAGESSRVIAAEFGVTTETVNGICRGHTWNEVLDGWTYQWTPKAARVCVNCPNETNRTWAGRCHACNEYWRRHGVDRVLGADGRVPGRPKRLPAPCVQCSRVAPLLLGTLCHTCYERERRARKAA